MARSSEAPAPQPPCPKCGHLADTSAGPVNFCPACGQDLRQTTPPGTLKNALIGQVIADRYRLLSLVGEGGMGAVYKAEHIRMGKALAIKILRGDFVGDAAAAERFKGEARIVSRLSHPHTIAVFDFGEIEGSGALYLAMEYVPGKDLAAILREAGKLPEARAVRIGRQLLGSLAEAHEAGIVHRDMKPGNVMLMQTRPGEDFAKVLDFGIAKLREEKSSLSSAGAIIGTPNYLAPEQARGDDVDARADLYAVGCLLYELVAGHPPFQGPNPMAVVSAHLRQEPPPLEKAAPYVSVRFAEIVHRALQKDPADRWRSADQMRDALLALAAPASAPSGDGLALNQTTGELQIANRDDFREFEVQLEAMKRSRWVGPFVAGAALLAVLLVAWRWDDVFGLLNRSAPALAHLLPAALRPASLYDGNEHEPNDVPALGNPLPIPPGADGQPGGGVAVMRGFVGAKIAEDSGDVDIFRVEVPEFPGGSAPPAPPSEARRGPTPAAGSPGGSPAVRVLVAEWHGEKPGEGIRGLDVAMSLNRERTGGDARTSAPLVATVNRAGPGRPEMLVASVEPGAYFLSIREVHSAASGPVEKPTDPYVLEVRLTEPGPGQELEPNDALDRVAARFERYPEWRELAERNTLGEGSPVRGDTTREDWDTWAIAPRGPGEAPEVVVALPEPALELEARLWVPDGKDVEPPSPPVDRVRFQKPQGAPPGEVLAVRLPAAPRADAPALLSLHAASGAGSYELFGLGQGSASAALVLARMEALARDGREVAALQLAAAYAGLLPRSLARNDVLVASGRLAESVADRLDRDGVANHERAGRLLGQPVFEVEGERVRYHGVFEAHVHGEGRPADEAALRLVRLAAPCTPGDVAIRAAAFIGRKPTPPPDLLEEARLARARALEEAYFAAPDRTKLKGAVAAWRLLTGSSRHGAEAKKRVKSLSAPRPARGGAAPVCR